MARIREKANELAKKKLDRWTFHDLKRTVGTGMREYLKPPVDRAVVTSSWPTHPRGQRRRRTMTVPRCWTTGAKPSPAGLRRSRSR